MTSQTRYKCQLCNTSMAPSRVDEEHKTLCVACALKETTLDIIAQACTPTSLQPNPLWLASTWTAFTKQEESTP